MNILQLAKYYPPVYGGIELVEKMMTKAHRENDDEVYICAFSTEAKREEGEFGETILRIEEKMNVLNAPFSLGFFFHFTDIVKEQQIKRIYVHLPNPFMHEVVYRHRAFLKKQNVEVVAVYHSDIVNKSVLGDLYNWYFKNSIGVYTKIIVSSAQLWDSSPVLSPLKASASLRAVIPFCIEESGCEKKHSSFNKKLISIGRLVPYKGFDFLIRAFNNTPYELNIVGDGPLREKLQSIAAPNIKFHFKIGHQQKNELLASCDLMIVGSKNRAEAFGMTIVESFAQSIPVIAPMLHTGVNFLVQQDKTGLIYEVENEKQLRERVDQLEKDPQLYETLSKSCREFYNQNLTFEKFKKNLINL